MISNKTIEKLKEIAEFCKATPMPSIWDFEDLESYVNGLFSFSKFKVGNTVEMAETYPVSTKYNWGWLSYRHLLTEGRRARVLDVDWRNGAFIYGIQFEENTWIDDKNQINPCTSAKGCFYLSEKWLRTESVVIPIK